MPGVGAAPAASGGVLPGGGGGGQVLPASGGSGAAMPASGGSSMGGSAPAGGSGAAPVQNTGGSATDPTACSTPEEETFSFFVLSREALQRESGTVDGFGGDLGGLVGADAICQSVAEYVSPCQVKKVWRAFLSTANPVVNAIERIGQGPWHDRVGRLLANNPTELLNDRPTNADPQIINDFPNEYGIPNHDPDGTGEVDNHEILTGTGTDGKLYVQASSTGGFDAAGTTCGDREEWTAEKATCFNWTSSEPEGCPRVGHSWPRDISGINWISVWNEGGCAPGGVLTDAVNGGGPDGTRRVGSAGGYGGWYCFAVTP